VPRRIDEVTAQLAGRNDAIDRTDLLGPFDAVDPLELLGHLSLLLGPHGRISTRLKAHGFGSSAYDTSRLALTGFIWQTQILWSARKYCLNLIQRTLKSIKQRSSSSD
jgi:hypothetical protein